MKKILFLLLMVTVIAVAAGCKKGPSEQTQKDYKKGTYPPAYGGTLVVGSIGEPSVLIPMLSGDRYSTVL
jgi:hypothetical protein